MQGPPNLAPGWQAAVPPGGGPGDLPASWPVVLDDEGYDKVYVSTNGFLLFDDPQVEEYVSGKVCEEQCKRNGDPCNPGCVCETVCTSGWHWEGAGNWNWWPWQVPNVDVIGAIAASLVDGSALDPVPDLYAVEASLG